MKTILLIRHAKSSRDIVDLEDFYRPLAERGIKNAMAMGNYLKNIALKPELILCSSSHRTVSTWALLTKVAGWDKTKILFSHSLYLCSATDIAKSINSLSNNYSFISIIGHEPSLSEFIKESCNFSLEKFPTGSIALLRFKKLKKWKDFKQVKGKVTFMLSPAQLS
jgi:phosphohistidine phosphatase